MADINEVVVRGSAAGFAQEVLAGRYRLTAYEPVPAAFKAALVERRGEYLYSSARLKAEVDVPPVEFQRV